MNERASPSILIIDDEQLLANMFGVILEKNGFHVTYAYSGHEGVEIFRKNSQNLDLVLLDFLMPDLSGERVFERLREIDPTIKVLIMSGLDGSEKIDAIIKAGALGFMEKPCRFQQLVEQVSWALKNDVEK